MSAFVNPGLYQNGSPLPGGLDAVRGMVQPMPPARVDRAIRLGHVRELDDGGAEVWPWEEDQGKKAAGDIPHDGNLAEVLDDAVLDSVANRLLEGVEADIHSCEGYYDQFKQGVELLGIEPKLRLEYPFPKASGASHPLLKQALLSFRATAISELFPASGPARTEISGDATPDVQRRSDRKQNWLNYYLTKKDKGYRPDYNQMLPLLGMWGSMFRHVDRDPLRRNMPISRFLSPRDLVVDNNVTTTLSGPYRVTRIEPDIPFADLRMLQLRGWYRDIDLVTPTGDERENVAKDKEGRHASYIEEDKAYTLYHVNCVLDLEGFEHTDQFGDPSGLPIPYVATIDKDSQRILRLCRNWVQGDEDYLPRDRYVHYRYFPGLGFYGWGIPHLIGSDVDALTTMRRQAINANMLVSFPGGLRVKGLKTDGERLLIGPCEFKEIDTGGRPIAESIMPLPYKDVPGSFPTLMQEILEAAQRVVSVGDMAVGEGREDALPGTVIALIEKAVKLESAVIKDLHAAMGEELQLIAHLFGEAGPEVQYPYVINGKKGVAIAEDFRDNTDICPVSDPNIPTKTMRITQAQAKLMLAEKSGGMLDRRVAYESFLREMGASDAEIQALMPQQPQGQPADPVTEFQMLMKGKPLQVSPIQDHLAHIHAHDAQLTVPGLDKTPMFAPLMAHRSEHVAGYYTAQIQAMGIPVQPGQKMPPQVENQIAAAVAKASDALKQKLAEIAPPEPGRAEVFAKVRADELKAHVSEADSQRKNEQSARNTQAEMIKLQQQMTDNELQRRHDAQVAAMKLAETKIKAQGDLVDTLAGAQADAHVAKHETAQAVMEHHATLDTNKANVHVADAAIAAAKAQASKPKPKAK